MDWRRLESHPISSWRAFSSGELKTSEYDLSRCYKTLVQSQAQSKAQWLAVCRHVSASSQSLCFILSFRLLKFYNLKAMKWHNNSWQTNPSHHEEETQNIDQNCGSVVELDLRSKGGWFEIRRRLYVMSFSTDINLCFYSRSSRPYEQVKFLDCKYLVRRVSDKAYEKYLGDILGTNNEIPDQDVGELPKVKTKKLYSLLKHSTCLKWHCSLKEGWSNSFNGSSKSKRLKWSVSASV